jgi:hypothetical protein
MIAAFSPRGSAGLGDAPSLFAGWVPRVLGGLGIGFSVTGLGSRANEKHYPECLSVRRRVFNWYSLHLDQAAEQVERLQEALF